MNDALTELRIRESRRYVESPRCRELEKRLREFVQNAEDCLAGGGTRHRSFVVIGESGSGKSTSLKRAFENIEAFNSYQNGDEYVRSLISTEVPRPSSTKDLAIHLLEEMGLPASRRSNEHELFAMVKRQLRERRVLFLHLDEAQALLRAKTKAAVIDLQDRLKSLLSIPEWPLHTIYSGVPELASLLTGDQQLPNRSEVMRFSSLSARADKQMIDSIVSQIADNCSMKVSPDLTTEDFVGRLCAATNGCYGTLIEMIRQSCFLALAREKKVLEVGAFARMYERYSGSKASDNIFRANAWRDIERENALVDLVPVAEKRTRRV